MFSISAINDTDSRTQWEPLAPTKEAQEFHLTKTYHDGLLHLQNKEYVKARELLESVLKDPLIASALVDDESGESHLLQLRFLALKNLATVFLRQGSERHENALHCYLQAVEIDNKDSVVWNQLGTVSCSMGLLSISRWAFEQGLSCSPNNWNCMEKLLEVLIAIGDEVACLSVAELILRHWPSHSRALLVKNTIEELEPVPYAPRGIDKLKPNHVRLKFLDKRKATDANLDQGITSKRVKKNIEVELAETSWTALADALLDILNPLSECLSEMEVENTIRSGDVNILVRIPLYAENSRVVSDGRELTSTFSDENNSLDDLNTQRVSILKEKEGNFLEEQPHERRSTRLERLRSRKPGKEEIDFDSGKDLAKVTHYLEPFFTRGSGASDTAQDASCSDLYSDQGSQCSTEYSVVSNFLRESSSNYGAYHLGHLLLERAAISYLSYQNAFIKFLELEKLIRHWGKDRTPECNIFLAELYFDFASSFSDASKKTEFMLEASYHICKIIEMVALEYPWNLDFVSRHESSSQSATFQGAKGISADNSIDREPQFHCLLRTNKRSFWVRFFWLSGQLSIWDGNKVKAHEELCTSLSHLTKEIDMDASMSLVKLPHTRFVKKLTIDQILHDINILKVESLMEKTVPEMVEKQMFMECKNLLCPLLLSTNDVYVDPISLHCMERMSGGFTSTELSALDILRKSCEKINPMDIEVYVNSHKRKLQILSAAAGMEEYFTSFKSYPQKPEIKTTSTTDVESKERSSKHWNHLVAEEVKAISRCVSEVKNYIDHSGDPNSICIDPSTISDLQSSVLSVMCNVASVFLGKKSSGQVITDRIERCCFVDGAIVFCKLQHLDLTVPLRIQVELLVAMHELLAEYGLCCWGEGGSGEEGTFLKFAIKHLLALDMKFKSGEKTQSEDVDLRNNSNNLTSNQPILQTLHAQMGHIDKASATETVILESTTFEGISSNKALELDGSGGGCAKQGSNGSDGKFSTDKKTCNELAESGNNENEEEKEELELKIDSALDQCFFCLYGLNLRCDSSYEDDLATHKNTSRGDYQTKEQCADVLQYVLPYAKASSRTGLIKLRRVLRAIRKHFPQPTEDILAGNAIDKFLDDSSLCEDKLSEEAGSDKFLETMKKILLNEAGSIKQYKASLVGSSEPYLDVYCNLYYFLSLSEETNATDKWPGFVLTKEGEEFVQHNAKLLMFDLMYNPLRFESWQRLANIYDEEVDLLLNDGSKHINVAGWRKNDTLPQRVEISRRRSRRCLLMSLALAKSPTQQGEIHELLALVYYDSLQNVVPFYDQRSAVPTKDAKWILCCENSLKHFKKAFAHKQDWSHAFYMGKLSEKLGYSHEISLSHYAKAITLNPSAVDPVYRMHASRLKLLCKCGKQSLEVFKVLSTYTFDHKTGDTVMEILNQLGPETSQLPTCNKDRATQSNSEEEKKDVKLKEVWNILYNDCLSALESCVEGDLKHFHKARFILAQGMYKRGESGDLEKAKDELSFCFKSSRSSFTINMWEIDSMVKRGRRKTPGFAGMKKILEVNLPESSRKFITCIRKYLLFYLKLLEETGDILTLERAYISLRADKRFSLCIEDLVPVSLGRYIKALIASIQQTGVAGSTITSSSEHVLEKLFALFIEQGNLWPEICSLSEIKHPGFSEIILYSYLHEHIKLLERNRKLENLEAVNEKIRKRFKNSKFTNVECTKICKHASIAWSRSLIINLALITPLQLKSLTESQIPNLSHFGLENNQLLCVDLQINELWSSAFDDSADLRNLQMKWSPILSKIKNVFISKATDENSETAQSLLRSSYNFYRESSCVMLPPGINLYMVPHRLATGMNFHPIMDGVEILDISLPRKLLLWAYTLLHGHCANISAVVKHCEENLKSKTKKGHGNSSTPPSQTSSHGLIATHAGVRESFDAEASLLSSFDATNSTNTVTFLGDTQKKELATAPQLHQCKNTVAERTDTLNHGDPDQG